MSTINYDLKKIKALVFDVVSHVLQEHSKVTIFLRSVFRQSPF